MKQCRWGKVEVIAMGLLGCSIINGSQASTLVNFHGTLISNPPCDITGDNDPITIDFGEMGITRIDGSNYMQDFALTITCGNDLGNAVQLYIAYEGQPMFPYDPNAIVTSREGLGVRLYYQGQVIPPNDDNRPIVLSGGGQTNLSLSAVPIRDPAANLLEGTFIAMGTVEIRYP